MKFLPSPPPSRQKGLFSFPHISRIFSAQPSSLMGKKILWAALVGCICINLYTQANYSTIEWEKLIPMLQSPLSALSHAALAHTLESEGRLTAAHQEMLLAYDLGLPVLGATTKNSEASALPYWANIAHQYPTYRDGHLMLAWTYFKQGDAKEARIHAETARALDPANASAQTLLDLLNK